MPDFDFAGLEGLALPEQSLGEGQRVSLQVGAGAPAWTVSGLTFNIRSALQIRSFTQQTDEDSDGILGKAAAKPKDATRPGPQIVFQDGQAWLKYRLEASLGLSAGFKAGGIAAVGLEAGLSAVIGEYRLHAADETARQAVLSDLGSLRLGLSLSDVLSLRQGEAVFLQVAGRLKAGVDLGWSDVLRSNLNRLNGMGQMRGLWGVRTQLGAKASFEVSVEDDFLLIFSRASRDAVRVSVRKARHRRLGAEAGLNIRAELIRREDTEKRLSDLLGQPLERIDKLVRQASGEDLDPLKRALLAESLERVGFQEAVEDWKEFQQRWQDFKQQFTTTLERLAAARVEAGFRYTYLRTSSDTTLLQVVLEDRQLATFHGPLLHRDLRPLIDASRQSQVELETYLHEKSVERTHTMGFSLGIGPFTASSADTLHKKRVEQTDLQGCKCIAYQGYRQYVGKEWGGNSVTWRVDFSAQMEGFSPVPGDPRASDFQIGLSLDWKWQERKLTKDDLAEYLDQAAIWHIVAPQEQDRVFADLRTHLQAKERAEIALELIIEAEEFRRLLPKAVAALGTDSIFHALGEAMPWWDVGLERSDPHRRRQLYAPLWKTYFRDPQRTFGHYAAMAAGYQPLNRLRLLEGQDVPGSANNRTFASVVRNNGATEGQRDFSGIARSWEAFGAGLSTLEEALRSSSDHRKIENAFDQMVRFWDQAILLRALGIYLIDSASLSRPLLSRIERTMTVSFPTSGEVFTYGPRPAAG